MNSTKILSLFLIVFFTQAVLSSEISNLSQGQLLTLQESSESIILIDNRSAHEFKNGHIKGAINISVSQIYGRTNELPKDKKLVLYCQSGARANRALKFLSSKGYTQLNHLQGDMNAWIKNNRLIVN